MKTSKKLICFLCCLVVIFTCASVSWQPEAEAAAPIATYVSSLVGSFILSAGFSFDNRGDFQSATEAFLESDVARGITEITDHVGRICALGNLSEPLLIHSLIKSDFFKDFWNSIYDFFGSGDITIETEGTPAPSPGHVILNGVEVPSLPSYSNYTYQTFLYYNGKPWLWITTSPTFNVYYNNNDLRIKSLGTNSRRYVINNDAWKLDYTGSSGGAPMQNISLNDTTYFVWSNYDINLIDTDNDYAFISTHLGATPVITEGQENYDVIGVYNNEVYTPTDIINSWERVAENGGTIDWALDSIPAYGDITSGDKDAPVTQTQSGVLTQSGVKVQTDEEVKEEVKEEAIQELKNYTVTGLASIFPFCIPFDIYNFFSVLTAEREAPVFDFPLDFGKLGSHHVHVDLSGWNTVAQILRTIELLAFCVALAWGTSKLIKW